MSVTVCLHYFEIQMKGIHSLLFLFIYGFAVILIFYGSLQVSALNNIFIGIRVLLIMSHDIMNNTLLIIYSILAKCERLSLISHNISALQNGYEKCARG